MKTTNKLPLDMIYHWEATKPGSLYLTQPFNDGSVDEYTWRRAADEARRVAAYLKSLDFPAGSCIGLISKNCAQWVIADWAIWMAGYVSVPIYPTLNATTVEYIIEHAECKALFVGKLDDWDMMKPGVPQGLLCISFPSSPPNDFVTWNNIIRDTPPLEGKAVREADELATIVYTSGSTGQPKGVMLSFGNMAFAGDGVTKALKLSPDDRMMSYLPLAHVFERTYVQLGSLYNGFKVYFVDSLDTFMADIQRAQPTLFLSVPRLWVKFQQGVLHKLPKKKLDMLLKIPIVSGVVKKKILNGLGLGKIKFAGSGSAPLSSDVLDWYRNLGLELLEGYGMAENFAYSHLSRPGRSRTGYVGETMPGVEARISDEGEILVKSPTTMVGYYKDDERSRETFTDDGFLKTGDKGELDDMGRLKVTGRTKEMFKTSKGKYIVPAALENRLMASNTVQLVCVSGANQTNPFVFVQLSDELQPKLADPALRKSVESDLKALLDRVNSAVDPHEKLAFMVVITQEWTIENSFLTPTMKLKRNVVEEAYKSEIESWYAQGKPVMWH